MTAAATVAAAPAGTVLAAPAASPLLRGAQVPALDGVRGLAILVVVLHNASYVPHGANDSAALKLWTVAMGAGWAGVQLFFVLSGLLITGILLDTRGRAGWLRAFYMRRVLRIFPLYYLTLLAYFVAVPLALGLPWLSAGDHARQAWYWSYLANWPVGPAGPGGNLGHFWSLAVEEQFYLAWPLVVLALSARGLRRACVGVVAAAFLVRLGLHLAAAQGVIAAATADAAGYAWTIARMDALAAGALCALLLRADRPMGPALRTARAGAAVAAAALLVVVALNRSLNQQGALVQVAGQPLLTALAAWVVLELAADAGGGRLARLFGSAPLRWLGRYSYAIYVLHMLVHRWAVVGLGVDLAGGSATRRLLLTAGYALGVLAATCLLALASWHLVEQPFLRLKRHFEPGARTG